MCGCVYVSMCKWTLVSLVVFLRAEPLSGHPMIMDTLDCWQWEWTPSIELHVWDSSACVCALTDIFIHMLGMNVFVLDALKDVSPVYVSPRLLLERKNAATDTQLGPPGYFLTLRTHMHMCIQAHNTQIRKLTLSEAVIHNKVQTLNKSQSCTHTYATKVLCCFSLQGTSAHSIQHAASTRRDCPGSV